MPGDIYPKFRAAAVQAAPVFLDRDATIDKLDTLVLKAVDAGADLIVFGESFIPAFPVWNLIYAPMDQHGFFRRLFENAVQVPGPHTMRLGEIARRYRVILSVGITEKGSISMGALWNTNLLFDRDGTLLNRHRKLVPTWAEKLTWANVDAAYLRPEDTDIGRVGALICGENTNTLARFALLAQGGPTLLCNQDGYWVVERVGRELLKFGREIMHQSTEDLDGSVRDLDGISESDMPAYIRGADATPIGNVMLTGINVPVRIGATTVMPGDLVVGDREGVYFILPQFAKEVLDRADEIHIHDEWTKKKFAEGKYKSSEVYSSPLDPKLQ